MPPAQLSLHIGEPLREVLEKNKRSDFDPKRFDDDIPLIWPEDDSMPVVFAYTYNDPSGDLRFPRARMVWVTQFAGVVTDVLVSASESKGTLQQFYAALQNTAADFKRAGWTSSIDLPSFAALSTAVTGSNANSLEGGILTFRKGTVSALLTLKGFSQDARSASPADAEYVLNIQFSDLALHDTQEKKVYDERLRVNGSVNKSLKLSYWLNRP